MNKSFPTFRISQWLRWTSLAGTVSLVGCVGYYPDAYGPSPQPYYTSPDPGAAYYGGAGGYAAGGYAGYAGGGGAYYDPYYAQGPAYYGPAYDDSTIYFNSYAPGYYYRPGFGYYAPGHGRSRGGDDHHNGGGHPQNAAGNRGSGYPQTAGRNAYGTGTPGYNGVRGQAPQGGGGIPSHGQPQGVRPVAAPQPHPSDDRSGHHGGWGDSSRDRPH